MSHCEHCGADMTLDSIHAADCPTPNVSKLTAPTAAQGEPPAAEVDEALAGNPVPNKFTEWPTAGLSAEERAARFFVAAGSQTALLDLYGEDMAWMGTRLSAAEAERAFILDEDRKRAIVADAAVKAADEAIANMMPLAERIRTLEAQLAELDRAIGEIPEPDDEGGVDYDSLKDWWTRVRALLNGGK